jgi:FkbM family methyltransferase
MNQWLNEVVKNYRNYFGEEKKPVIWEVGSRDGDDAVELAERIYDGDPKWFWSNVTIVALEPNPDQAAVIREKYPEMEVHELAASDAKGSAPFMVYEGDAGAVGSSSLDLNWKSDLPGRQIVVETDRLDNLVGDEEIDIMKIDVEGHAMQVIEGLGDKLKKVKVFHVETDHVNNTNVKMKAFMMGHGYRLADETEQYGGLPDQVWVRF